MPHRFNSEVQTDAEKQLCIFNGGILSWSAICHEAGMKIRITTLIFIATFLSGLIHAQSFTTKGKLFWLGFMENYYVPETRVYISADAATTGTISIPLQGWSQNFTVTPGVATIINLTAPLPHTVGSNVTQPNGVRIQTQNDVSVYMINYASYTSDASLVLPIQTLGDEYFATTHKDGNTFSDVSEIMIVAAYDNSTFEITPSVNTISGQNAGVPYQVTLNAGQVYQVQSDFDLSGTFVRSVNTGSGCKKFALYGGNKCTGVDCPYCDHLVDQMYPNNTLGQNYVLPHLTPRGYTKFRVVATKNGTQFTVNAGPVQNLNAGQHTIFNLSANGYLSSNQPVSVMQYSIGNDCDPNNLGDPFMILMSPVEQLLDRVTFTAIASPVVTDYYLLVTTKTANVNLVTLDGGNISGSFVPVPSNPAYAVASLTITQGDHTIQSDSGFLAYTYAYGPDESYGYSAGANLSNLYAQLTYASTDFDTIVCPGDTILFAGVGDTSIVSYEWDFGDGNTAIGQNAAHTYASLGFYPVKMIIERFNACEKDTLTDTLRVLGPIVTNVDDDTMCVGGSLTFTANGGDNYFWSTGATTQSVTLSPAASTTYSVYATISTCAGIPDTFNVTVIDPALSITWLGTCMETPFSFYPVSSTSAILDYQWNFGDGGTDTVYNPQHTYTAGGTYNVHVDILTVWGCTISADTQIVISPTPSAAFAASDVCEGNSIAFNNTTSGGNFNSQWYFGNGDSSLLQSPTYVYPDTGTYAVTLIASAGFNSSCKDTALQNVTVHPQAISVFTGLNACRTDSITFTNNSSQLQGETYLWNFGDGVNSFIANPAHLYNSADTFLVTLIAITPSGCNDTTTQNIIAYPIPVADFNVPVTCPGTTSNFTNQSTLEWGTFNSQWDFGDGGASSNSNPGHNYASNGSFTVLLTVTSDNNCTDTVSKQATVAQLINADFNWQGLNCTYSAITFNNTSTTLSGNALSYEWNFDDGNNSLIQSPVHTYITSDTFNVTLVISDSTGCRDTIPQLLTIFSKPVADFVFDTVCPLSSTTFYTASIFPSLQATSQFDYFWDFGNGEFLGDTSESFIFPGSGNFNVQHVVYGSGCSDTIIKTVPVYPAPVAGFNVADVCFQQPSTFTNTSTIASGSITFWNWSLGDGNISNAASTTHLYSDTGSYVVTLITTSDAGCSDTFSSTAIVHFQPVADFAFSDVCIGNDVFFSNASSLSANEQYQWLFGDTQQSSSTSPSHTYTNAGSYDVQLIAYTSFCADTSNRTVIIYPLPVPSFSANDVCLGDVTVFQNNSSINTGSINAWNWNLGDGNFSNLQQLTHAYSTHGNYTVQLIATSDFGCVDSFSSPVTVFPLPDATYTSTIACYGENNGAVSLNPFGSVSPYTVNWSNGDIGYNLSNASAAVYGFTVTDANNCTFASSATVQQQPYPVILTVDDTIEIDLGESATIHVSGNYDPYLTYQWTPSDLLGCTDCQSNTIDPLENISYNISATDTIGCKATATVFVLVNPEHIVFVPNVFTPNGDGANDEFLVFSKAVKQFELQLFNRWGEKVFETNDLNSGWDGVYKGEIQPPGVYVYNLNIVYLDNYTRNGLKGSVTLLR